MGTCHGNQSNGLPFANNASGVLYNPEIFAKYGVAVPTTWDEFIAAADTFKANGVNPFFMTLKDAWTALPSYVNLAGNLMPADFFDDVRSAGWTPGTGKFSFEKNGGEAATKLAKLFSYAQTGCREPPATTMATPHSVPANRPCTCRAASPSPPSARRTPTQRSHPSPTPPATIPPRHTLVSGVDVTLAIGKDTKHPAEAKKFVDYLMSPTVLDYYAAAQSSLTPVTDAAPSTDPALAGMQGFFAEGKVIGYFDHHVPPSIPLAPLLQQYILDRKQPEFLSRMDHEFEKVAARTITKKGD